jgi:acyl dehydratase
LGLYYEDLEIGMEFISPRRTMTEADITIFTGLSGDYNPLHTDEIFCQEETPFGGRIAQGLLTVSAVTGLISRLGYSEHTVLAFLGLSWKFNGAVKPGDTIQARIVIHSKRETSKPDRGLFVQKLYITNQNGEQVQEGEMTLLVSRRPS